MDMETVGMLGILGTIVAVILVYVCILPESKYAGLNKFGKWLSDLFHFRTLWLEHIIRFCYVVATVFCVVFGFFMLFGEVGYYYYSESLAGYGLGLMIIGPIVIRLVYEGIMMSILLVKNVMEINNRLRNKGFEEKSEPKAPVSTYAQPAAPQPENVCANCGKPVSEGAFFCTECGNKLQ